SSYNIILTVFIGDLSSLGIPIITGILYFSLNLVVETSEISEKSTHSNSPLSILIPMIDLFGVTLICLLYFLVVTLSNLFLANLCLTTASSLLNLNCLLI